MHTSAATLTRLLRAHSETQGGGCQFVHFTTPLRLRPVTRGNEIKRTGARFVATLYPRLISEDGQL
jgi:hypothetical protein